MLALLDDAIHCFRTYVFARTTEHKRLYRDADRWLFGSADATEARPAASRRPPLPAGFSFSYVCEALGLDGEAVRAELRRWRNRERASQIRATARRPRIRPLGVIARRARHRRASG